MSIFDMPTKPVTSSVELLTMDMSFWGRIVCLTNLLGLIVCQRYYFLCNFMMNVSSLYSTNTEDVTDKN